MTTIDTAVNRFLGWKLPADFSPDGGVRFTPPENPAHGPSGTNLLNALQAKEMLQYVLAEPADHRDRVRAEHAELSDRLSKLYAFFEGPIFLTLSEAEQARLRSQARFMDGYAAVLEERIAAFPA